MPRIDRALNVAEFKQLLVQTFPHLTNPYLQPTEQGAEQKPAVLSAQGPSLRDINRDELLNDFARIGSFLSDTAQVDTALQILEADLRTRLREEIQREGTDTQGRFHRLQGKIDTVKSGTTDFDYQGLQGTMMSRTTNARGNRVLFKTHKLLSSTLKAQEDSTASATSRRSTTRTPRRPSTRGRHCTRRPPSWPVRTRRERRRRAPSPGSPRRRR